MSYDPSAPTRGVCDWPSCAASYDVVAVMDGRERAPGWRAHRGFDLHMCGEHSPLVWGPDGRWHLATGSTGTSCSCGSVLEPDGPTLGDLAAAYLRHIVAATQAA